eukprot:gnl/Hemi2/14072_TR4776_c0_g8_i1.p2 gnl/Hemi2/14072_TR4776_c0_g8~~gnl/Hemi2/14072_TR4776_c0_g8_i1.p2  ORF type:complete len:177 (-),score=61.55 gnl/Hemi2/14072_TR4776_c0_g8_i1:85-615(-)
MLFTNGVQFHNDLGSGDQALLFQINLLRTQMHFEDSFHALAKLTRKPTVLLCDRGAMDGSAYIEPDAWQAMLQSMDLSTKMLRDERYSAVFHLVTAAIGAPDFFSGANNTARYETVPEAAMKDDKLRQAWVDHPNFFFFDNTTGFEEKLCRIEKVISDILGIPYTKDECLEPTDTC